PTVREGTCRRKPLPTRGLLTQHANSIASREINSHNLPRIDLTARSWILLHGETFTARFQSQAKPRTVAQSVAHALPAQVRHHCPSIRGHREDNFVSSPGVAARGNDFRQSRFALFSIGGLLR